MRVVLVAPAAALAMAGVAQGKARAVLANAGKPGVQQAPPGARAATHDLTLADFAPLFAARRIVTGIRET